MALSIKADTDELLARLGEQAGDISVQCSDTGGIVARLNRQISAEAERLGELVGAMDRLTPVAPRPVLATEELLHTAAVAQTVLERGTRWPSSRSRKSRGWWPMSPGSTASCRPSSNRLGTIGGISRTLSSIAEQSELLSFNARIEAARGGEATRPFEVLATEIRHLAATTSQSSAEVGRNIAALQNTAGTLIGSLKANIANGRESTKHIDALREALTEMARAGAPVSRPLAGDCRLHRAGRERSGQARRRADRVRRGRFRKRAAGGAGAAPARCARDPRQRHARPGRARRRGDAQHRVHRAGAGGRARRLGADREPARHASSAKPTCSTPITRHGRAPTRSSTTTASPISPTAMSAPLLDRTTNAHKLVSSAAARST